MVPRYRRWRAPEESKRRVEPYGLVLNRTTGRCRGTTSRAPAIPRFSWHPATAPRRGIRRECPLPA
ncbi:hypothetical protein [Streptomyces sp. NPDC048720]|uniref:WYL domain-containing protein n=1 Tax=Streptomyces sp. NPDC048720 TaxID=3365588 RepID=UPI00371CA686